MKVLDVILEATQGQIYAIGDSHAEGICYDKRVTNRAYGGQPSTSQTNYNGTKDGRATGLDHVPAGSSVIIAQGANDTANSAKAHISSKGKTPLVPPQTIATNVASLVRAAHAKKCKVVFVLFPNGEGRAPGLAQYYSGDYQEEVRKAIKAAVGVPVIDLQGRGLSPDGIHGTPGAYKSAAAEAIQALGGVKSNVGTDDKVQTQPQSADAEEKPDGPQWDKDGNYIRGSFLRSMGIDPSFLYGDDNKTTTKVGGGSFAIGDVKPSERAKTAVKFFISKGWTPQQAAGIVGNLQAESGVNLDNTIWGDKHTSYGIAQWRGTRQADFKKKFGHDITKSSFEEQLEFVQWELDHTETKAARYIRSAKTAKEAAAYCDEYYERSSGAHRNKRIAYANNLIAPTVA